ncbi:MAG: hypothetical protein GXP49_00195 [Deltaproteobacteria bacterium]|nr:hypothetical protein [Deltaproteobacteria bacterium]
MSKQPFNIFQTRTCRIAIVLFLSSLFQTAGAKEWSGVSPGVSTMADVKRHLGEPTKVFQPANKAYKEAWNYQFSKGLAKRKGVRQASFFFDFRSICKRIDVFPTVKLKLKDIEAAYGNNYRRGLTSNFQRYIHYADLGLAVFIEDDGVTVFSIQFLEPFKRRRTSTNPRSRSHDQIRMKPARGNR